MRKMLFTLVIVALLVTVAGCTDETAGVSSDDIPDPTTQFLNIRNQTYEKVWKTAESGGIITLDMRIAYARCAIHSYAYGYEADYQFKNHLIFIDYPEGSQLTAQGYEFKSIIVWLRRGEIDLDSADERLIALSNQRQKARGW
jgi:hypothetical protein